MTALLITAAVVAFGIPVAQIIRHSWAIWRLKRLEKQVDELEARRNRRYVKGLDNNYYRSPK